MMGFVADDHGADVEILTVQEYAKLTRVHVQTVYSAIRRGLFKYPIERVTNSTRSPIRIIVPRESRLGIQARTHTQ